MAKNEQPERAKAEPKPEGQKATYHVAGPGSVSHGGELRKPGATLELTEAEAKSLGPSVAPGRAPDKRKSHHQAGSYRVTDFGSIYKGGKFFHAGALLDLTEDEAKQFADRIVPA